MKPRHTAEQSTVKVNKSEMTGKRGFGALSDKKGPIPQMSFEKVASVPEPVSTPTPVTTPSPVSENVFAMPPASVERAPVMAEKPKITVHGPEDPQDALLCESCQ